VAVISVAAILGDYMSEEKAENKVKKPKAETLQTYINTGANAFTTKGRVSPGGTICLLPSEAKNYKGLKRKQ